MVELKIAAVILLLALSAFFSGSEAALFSLSKLKLARLKNPIIERLLAEPNRLLTGLLSGTTVVNITACVIATSIFIDIFSDRGWPKELAVLCSISVMTFAIVVFAEVFPISFGAARGEVVAPKIAKLVSLFIATFSPFINGLIRLCDQVVSLFGRILKEEGITQEEIETMVEVSSIKDEEKRMIDGIFELSETLVKDVMVPLKDVVSVAEDTKITELLSLVQQRGHSRIPVYREKKENIVGVVHTKDLLSKFRKDGTVSAFIRTPYYVWAQKRIGDLLKEFQKRKVHIGIVKERGKIVGIVTMEDLLEEIVGEIEGE